MTDAADQPEQPRTRPVGLDALIAKKRRRIAARKAAIGLLAVAALAGALTLAVTNRQSASRKQAKVNEIVERACGQETVEAARRVIFAAEDAGDLSPDDDGMLKVYDCVGDDPTNEMDFGEPDPGPTGTEPPQSSQPFDPNAAAVLGICERRWPNDSRAFFNCVEAFKVDGVFVDPYGN